MTKDEILINIATVGYTAAQNIMGCSESWYNPYYAIKNTFSYEELEKMSEEELNNLIKLAVNISEAFY